MTNSTSYSCFLGFNFRSLYSQLIEKDIILFFGLNEQLYTFEIKKCRMSELLEFFTLNLSGKTLILPNEYLNIKERKDDECTKTETYSRIRLLAETIKYLRIKHIRYLVLQDIVYGT